MSNNKKRAIKARKQKFNETHSTARMHVLGSSGGPPRQLAPILGEWTIDSTPELPSGTLVRYAIDPVPDGVERKPLVVVRAGGLWRVLLASSMKRSLVDGSFAAPNARIACLYADDYLYSTGYTGPGVGTLPSGYPALRERTSVLIPSKHERFVMNPAAKCACGYVGESIVDRYEPCPECGACTVIMAEMLASHIEDGDQDWGPLATSRHVGQDPMVLHIRAHSRRWGRSESVTFTRLDDGWHIDNGVHRHPTRPDGTAWGRKRVGGHRGLGFFLINESYRSATEKQIGAMLAQIWSNPAMSRAQAEQALQAMFSY